LTPQTRPNAISPNKGDAVFFDNANGRPDLNRYTARMDCEVFHSSTEAQADIRS
jgi:hypothetical protein